MKIAMSSAGIDLEAALDPRFGRCQWYLVVDLENFEFEAFENENAALGGGAGIQAAQFVASKGAEAVITGHCGPNAVQTLNAAGITLYAGQSGRLRELLEKYNQGQMSVSTEANARLHAGSGGQGMGRGRRMGGRGRGAAGLK